MTIEPDKGYYIYMAQDAVLTVTGSPIAQNRLIELQPGWNLIGWTTIEQRPASDVLAGIASDPEHVAWGLDEMDAADPWKFYASAEAGSDLVQLEPGEGYWVHVSSTTSITVPAGIDQEYHYDSQDRRLGSVVIYDGENQIAEYDGLGNLLVSYLQGPGIDNPISMTRDGQTYYYHTDALGSVMELTDSDGNVAQSYRYDAFGSIMQQSGNVENPFTYTGREYDSGTGLYYYRARYYDAEVGRFDSPDINKLGILVHDYSYGLNNPVRRKDPLGLEPLNCATTELEAEQFENRYLQDSDCAGPCSLFRECDKQE